jgi:ribonuclease HI
MLCRHAGSKLDRRGERPVTTTIYFDAFYRRETGEIYTAVVCEDHSELTFENLLATSSGHAEWLAALSALEYAATLRLDALAARDLGDIKLVGDARVVTDQMENPDRLEHNEAKRNPELVAYQRYAMSVCEEIGGVEWEWMSTDENPAGKFIRRKQAAGAMRTKGLWG